MLAQSVSPPDFGTLTPWRMLAKGGSGLKVKSLCQSAVSGLLFASFLRRTML